MKPILYGPGKLNLQMLAALVTSLFLVTAAVAQDSDLPGVPKFTEQAIQAGIQHQYTGPFEYFAGGGVASFDCNNDRMPDVFIAGGEGAARLYVNNSRAGTELRFTQTQIPGVDLTRVIGAYPINLENDAYPDLVVLRLGENYLLRGGANCTFKMANEAFGFDGRNSWTTGFSAVWESGAKYPTLVFGNYIDRDAPGSPFGTCEDNRVVRALGEPPQFSENYPLSPGYCSLSALITDWNNTGQFDIRLTNDRQYYRDGREQLWSLNNGGQPVEYTANDGWAELVIWGMGIAQADLDGDERPEYALTSMGDTMLQTLNRQALAGQPDYRDIAFEKGTTAHRPYQGDNSKPSTGWHTQFADFNNDGLLDLFIAKGNVERMPGFAAIDPDNLLLGSTDGRFVERGGQAGIALPRRGRGAVVVDFNADGLLDLLVVNREEPVSLFRNLGGGDGNDPLGNFLAIQLQNGSINPSAIGAVVEVVAAGATQTTTVQIGGGHASGQIGLLHFGLAKAENAQVRVKWPNAGWSATYTIAANSFVTISNGSTQPQIWHPADK